MPKDYENIILFPKLRKNLEKESLRALKEGRYNEALPMLNQLLTYNINSHEIVLGKLVCLMELGQYEKAQNLCEDLLADKDENYYHYMHIYLTLLFQTNQFDILTEQIELELEEKHIPISIEEQFKQLYQMSDQMKSDLILDQTNEYIEELSDAIHNKNYERQWKLVENLRKMKIEPTSGIITYLDDESIHPVIKTAIFKWLQDREISDSINICKLNQRIMVKPIKIKGIRQHTLTKQVLFLINKLEQKNPTLFILLEQLFYRYIYVRFPIMPPDTDVEEIATALENLGNQYLHVSTSEEDSPKVTKYVEEIKLCERLYLSIIEE